jgi:hypothetical protein
MRAAGGFTHVTSTRILKPEADRTYFYLVYGTRHLKGLMEFRGVEKKAINEQELVRFTAKQTTRVERTRQTEMFTATSPPGAPPSFEEERSVQRSASLQRLRNLLEAKPVVSYEEVLATVLELPLVWESDVKSLVMELRSAGELEVKGMKDRERTPKRGHFLIRKASRALKS